MHAAGAAEGDVKWGGGGGSDMQTIKGGGGGGGGTEGKGAPSRAKRGFREFLIWWHRLSIHIDA